MSCFRICTTMVFLLWGLLSFSQEKSFPFSDGEYGKYGVYYNWKFIWVYSGEVDFFTSQVTYRSQDSWHFKALGKTLKAYDFLYEVRDTFESYVSVKPFRSLYFRRAMNHGHKSSTHCYSFDYLKNEVNSEIHRHGEKMFHDTLYLPPNTYDLLSTAYYFRSFNFNTYRSGQIVPYRMLVDNVIADLYFRYLGTEIVKTRNGRSFRCHKVSVKLMQGDFFREGEYMKVWFTADKNQVPVQVETEILVGSVKVLLLETKSLRYKLESEIH